MIQEIVIAGSARTPIGSFNGAFTEVPAPDLGAVAIKAALERAGVRPDLVDEIILGNVLSAGLGQNVARQAGIKAGLPVSCGATTVNKMCGSAMRAVRMAAQAVQCGDASVVVAGGAENMTRAPYLLPKGRNGYRMGHGEVLDSMIYDGLTDAYCGEHMGKLAEQCAAKYGLTREAQDDFAIASYQRLLAAQRAGDLKHEITPVEVRGRKGSVLVEVDEDPTKFREDRLRTLPAVFLEGGTITAGNASSISDGAAAVVLTSAARAKALGLRPQARILGYAAAALDPAWFTVAPIHALRRLAERIDLSLHDVDLFEINEAFSVVLLAAMKELELPHDKVNVLGGAVAVGHPIGASGARILTTLINALRLRGGRIGMATACIGGGEAGAIAIERL